MSLRVFGLETEYGCTASPPKTPSQGVSAGGDALLEAARRQWTHLPAADGKGLFLANGGRFLIDSGQHPEYCTPEVTDPADLVRHAAAGDRLVETLAQALRQQGWTLRLFKGNVDYEGRTTWASHESYGHCGNPERLPGLLVPFLASRPVIAGAGGLDPTPGSLRFCLSPRACFLSHVTSHESTSERGLYHLKDESLAGAGWHRLHLLCGESLCSHRALWLRVGTTALVLALLEARVACEGAIELREPLRALRAFNFDPACRATAETVGRGPMTAVQIQRRYLNWVERHTGHPSLPAWAGEICRAWGEILDRLEQNPLAAQDQLDWATKWVLYRAHAHSRGLELGANGAVPAPAKVLALRQELCELELRYAELGPGGLFNLLDRGGHLGHQLPQVTPDTIQTAMTAPPADSRAGIRGGWIQRLARTMPGCRCDWNYIWRADHQVLDLQDPLLQREPQWRASGSGQPEEAEDLDDYFCADDLFGGPVPLRPPPDLRRQSILDLLLETRRVSSPALEAPHRLAFRSADLECRRGRWEHARSLLDQVAAVTGPSLSLAVQYVSLHGRKGLGPGEGLQAWIDRAEALCQSLATPPPDDVLTLRTWQGDTLLRQGRVTEAGVLLLGALEAGRERAASPGALAFCLARLSECERRLGDRAGADRHLGEAEQLQHQQSLLLEWADVTLPQRLKLHPESPAAGTWLANARRLQRTRACLVGLVRTLLLEARVKRDPEAAPARLTTIEMLRGRAPVLGDCPRLARVLAHWDQWAAGESPPSEPDFFWDL